MRRCSALNAFFTLDIWLGAHFFSLSSSSSFLLFCCLLLLGQAKGNAEYLKLKNSKYLCGAPHKLSKVRRALNFVVSTHKETHRNVYVIYFGLGANVFLTIFLVGMWRHLGAKKPNVNHPQRRKFCFTWFFYT